MDTKPLHTPEEEDLDLFLLIRTLCDHWLCILLAGLVFAGAAFLVSRARVQHHYQASFEMLISAQAVPPQDPLQAGVSAARPEVSLEPTVEDVALAKSITGTYAEILKSNTVLDPVLLALRSDMEYEDFLSHLTITEKKDLPILLIAFSSTDAAEAERTAFELSRIPPKFVSNIAKVGTCQTISQVEVKETGVTPNVAKYTVLGGAGGMLAAMVVIFLHFMLHAVLTDDKDVAKYLGLPVLGVIPQVKEGK